MWTIGIYDHETEELTAVVSYGPELTLRALDELKQQEAQALAGVAHVYLVEAAIPPLMARDALAAEWLWRNRMARDGLNALKGQRTN